MASDGDVPNTLARPAWSVPAVTSVAPAYVFAPESVSVPVPFLVRPPAPPIAPLSVAEVEDPVKIVAPPAPSEMDRPDANAPFVVMASVPLDARLPRVTPEPAAPSAPSAVRLTVLPPVTTVPPPYEFAELPSTSVPPPKTSSVPTEPPLEITPFHVTDRPAPTETYGLSESCMPFANVPEPTSASVVPSLMPTRPVPRAPGPAASVPPKT